MGIKTELLFLLMRAIPGGRGVWAIDLPTFSDLFFKIGVLSVIIGIVLGLVYWRNRQKTKRILWEQQLREEEQRRVRQRTAEDFHDEIGNKLTRIKLLARIAEIKLKEEPEEVAVLLAQIKNNAASLYTGAKDIIWLLQPESDFLGTVIQKIQMDATSLFEFSATKFTFEQKGIIPDSLKLPADYGRNLMMICKEACANILKHANATNAVMEIAVIRETLSIAVQDDGKGFPLSDLELNQGNGLQNMKRRADRLHGDLQVLPSASGLGTRICLSLLLPK